MNKSRKTRVAGLLVVVLCASLITPALAGAQQVSPTNDQYQDELSQINQGAGPGSNEQSSTGNEPGTAETAGLGGNVGPLPFTGFDVIAMLAVALAVAGAGLVLQRAVSRDASDEVG